jgi:dTDP-4-amino-4,6-dideoxygalactose transaminase
MKTNLQRKAFLPFHQPSIGEEEIQEVIAALKSGWITTGPRTKLFEEQFRDYIGCQHAIAVNSCTAGLHLALVAAGIGAGDEVITTPYTFAATGEVIIQVGARPVFVDIEANSLNIDPTAIERAITSRTRAIIPVHIAGLPCRMDEIIDIAQRHHLIVIEDAAHAFAAEYRGQKIGNIGQITVFSFYATKNLTTGEGGMVTTNDPEYAEKIRLLSLHGLSKDAWKRYSAEGSWYYEIIHAGYKYNMSDIQAALGLQQLKKTADFQAIRAVYATKYNNAFKDRAELILPHQTPDTKHAWHLYILRLKLELLDITRGEFIQELQRRQIGTSVHFIPLHLHPYYQKNFVFNQPLAQAENAFEQAISLPLYPAMSEEDVNYVIQAVNDILEANHRC